ncbi:unnamed protein product [Sympodiomycopsis kandeliae]
MTFLNEVELRARERSWRHMGDILLANDLEIGSLADDRHFDALCRSAGVVCGNRDEWVRRLEEVEEEWEEAGWVQDVVEEVKRRQKISEAREAMAGAMSEEREEEEEEEEEEEDAVRWCWQKLEDLFKNVGLEECLVESPTEIRLLMTRLGLVDNGFHAIKTCVEKLHSGCRSNGQVKTAILKAFPDASLDIKMVHGACYARSNELTSVQLESAFQSYRLDRLSKGKLGIETSRQIDAKIMKLPSSRSQVVAAVYIGATDSSPPQRIKTDEQRAKTGSLHGPIVELYRRHPFPARREQQFCLVQTGHRSDADRDNIEAILVELVGKSSLVNLVEGGRGSKANGTVVDSRLVGALNTTDLSPGPIHWELKWFLNSDRARFGFEEEMLRRSVYKMAARGLSASEAAYLPDSKLRQVDNLLESVDSDKFTGKEGYAVARMSARKEEAEAERKTVRTAAYEKANQLYQAVTTPTIALCCGDTMWLILVDYAYISGEDVEVFSCNGWVRRSWRGLYPAWGISEGKVLRVLRGPSLPALILVRTPHSVKASDCGASVVARRHVSVAISLRLRYLCERSLDPTKDGELLNLLTTSEALDEEFRISDRAIRDKISWEEANQLRSQKKQEEEEAALRRKEKEALRQAKRKRTEEKSQE